MRRSFTVPVTVSAGLLLLLVGAISGAQVARDLQPAPAGRTETIRVYEGVSRQGSVQEALDAAVARALRALPGADRMVRYRVREITGEQGGITGANIVRVEIEVNQPGTPAPVRPARPGAPVPARPDDEEPNETPLRAELELSDTSVTQNGSVTLTFTITNPTERTLEIPRTSGQAYDFEVLRDGRSVWRWGNGRLFTQALTSTVFRPGEAHTYGVNWNVRNNEGMRVPTGRYTVRAWIPSQDRGRVAEATAPITVR
ncbi:MAG: BsuPI-related putative proteinase inhibitor [Armatimonadota bacterium]